MPTYCQAPGCRKRSTFGKPDTKTGVYCVAHKRADDINVSSRRCKGLGCTKQPAYGPPNSKVYIYCSEHKRADDVNLKSKLCREQGCSIIPTYGECGTKIGIYCVTHKRDDDVYVKGKGCQSFGCLKQATYGYANTKIGLYCATHKSDEHVDVIHKKCQSPGCFKLPAYGEPNSKQMLYCAVHKNTGDIDLKNKRCQQLGCSKIASYGACDSKTGLYCVEHKRAGDVNVKCRKCQAPECIKQPTFGEPDTNVALYCSAHKRNGDIDMQNKRCQFPECPKQSKYGTPGQGTELCRDHAVTGMIISPRLRCEECLEIGIWGCNPTAKQRRCDAHRHPEDKNLIEGYCVSCGLECILDKLGICSLCGEAGKIKRQFLDKQKRIKTIIEGVFKIESYDRILDGGVCTKKRPDFVIKGLYRDLVLEVDERQHSRGKKYGPDCEYNRMWDIAQALGIATVFVRYNPDPFIDSEGKRRDPVTADREKILISWIKTLLSREPPKESFVTAVYLYYDGFDSPEKAAEEILMDPMNGFTKPVEFLPAEVLTCENLELLFTAFNIE